MSSERPCLPPSEEGGDAACWLANVCERCGAFNELAQAPCWRCGAVAEVVEGGLEPR